MHEPAPHVIVFIPHTSVLTIPRQSATERGVEGGAVSVHGRGMERKAVSMWVAEKARVCMGLGWEGFGVREKARVCMGLGWEGFGTREKARVSMGLEWEGFGTREKARVSMGLGWEGFGVREKA